VSTLRLLPPSPEVARFVEFYWHVRWDARATGPHVTKVLSHPNVHLVFEQPRSLVYGIDRGLFTRKLEDTGQVLGVKFRPGHFRPFCDGPVARLAGRQVPAETLFPGIDSHHDAVTSSQDPASLAEEFMLARLPEPDPVAADAETIVNWISAARQTFRVADVAREHGTTVRSLQRLFAEYVGASPKWVLRRARLHEAAARADAGPVDWAELAAELGYSDQSHFTRDFAAATGTTPARYAPAPVGR
jgi:AraC-like DNA-binding protein